MAGKEKFYIKFSLPFKPLTSFDKKNGSWDLERLKTSLVAQTIKHCLQCGRPGFHPWVGKICWRRKWQSTPVPGKSHGQRSLVGSSYSPWGRKESDTTERLHFQSLSKSCNWKLRHKIYTLELFKSKINVFPNSSALIFCSLHIEFTFYHVFCFTFVSSHDFWLKSSFWAHCCQGLHHTQFCLSFIKPKMWPIIWL